MILFYPPYQEKYLASCSTSVEHDSELDELASQLTEMRDWDSAADLIISLLSSDKPECRLSGLRALHAQLTGQYLGENVENAARAILNSLDDTFTGAQGTESEQKEAFVAVCNLCRQLFSGFERFAATVIEAIRPNLAHLAPGCEFQLWAIAFLAAFSFSPESGVPASVLSDIVNLMKNKKARSADFTREMMVEGICGMSILLSVIPVQTIVSDFLDDVREIADRRLASKKPDAVFAALDTLLVVHDVLVQYTTIAEEDCVDEAEELLRTFTNGYKEKFHALSRLSGKKADQKLIRKKCSEVARILDGKVHSVEIVLNSQTIQISGARNVTAYNAIRRVSGSRFQEQMTGNTAIQEFFGIEVMPSVEVKKMKRKYHWEFQRARVASKQQNEWTRAAQRGKKERAAVDEEDEFC
jgi:hypothetical protein